MPRPSDPTPHPDGLVEVRVLATRWEAEDIVSFRLAAEDGSALPAWTPGAHVDVHLPSGKVRQYSLCGDPADRAEYRIAVLRQPQGRGGSEEVHRELRAGTVLKLGSPRNDFALEEAPAYVFVAGGIGITPILPMIREAAARGSAWRLVYGARSRGHFAFLSELDGVPGGTVELYAQDQDGHPPLAPVAAAGLNGPIYCCGPAPLLDALAREMDGAGSAGNLRFERFAPLALEAANEQGFEVLLAASGTVVAVGPEVSVLDAVREAGVAVPSSCEMGICGTCETTVIDGTVDHRDDLLTPEEKAAGNSMMICVSRCLSKRLVLDL
ncbi:PDR/VanB family oxidoreductase [Arthrobacter ginkgonis]|uniref:PDR/VanB family oxidoreductase n=1 Tax=Arthrobacter ginkgonis TaxID=1630594 RepID=A0ABP7C991_9MICC